MKRLWILTALLLALAVPAWGADGSWHYPVPSLGGLNAGDLIYAPDSYSLSNKALTNTDGSVFVPALQGCTFASTDRFYTNAGIATVWAGFPIASRISSSVYAIARQAVATEPYYITCNLNSWLQRYGGTKGIKINTLGIAYQILAYRSGINTASGIATHLWGKLATIGYSNNGAIVQGLDLVTTPSTGGMSGSLATVHQANPYLTTLTLTTPAYLPAATNTQLIMEWLVALDANSIYRLFGVVVNFTRLDH